MLSIDKVNILGVEYKVEYKTAKEDEDLMKDNLLGYVDYYDKKIIIRYHTAKEMKEDFITAKAEKTRQKSTLLHEVLHAVLFESGYQNYCHDEDLINALTALLPKIKEHL